MKRWREKNGLSPDKKLFERGGVTLEDLKAQGFKFFSRGQIYGYERDAEGNIHLVFSAVFRPFAIMEEDLLDRFRWLAGWVTSLRVQLKGHSLPNGAHVAAGGGELLLVVRATTHSLPNM